MIVHTIKTAWADDQMKQNTFLVEFENSCVVIDAGCRLKEVMKLTTKPIKAVFITHGHFDHVQYIEEYRNAGIPIYAHHEISKMITDPDANASSLIGKSIRFNSVGINKIYEDDMLMIDGNAIYTYTTPGHSIDGMTYIIDDNMFSGDTVFSVAVGRTDLKYGDPEKLGESLEKLSQLKYENLYCGHGRESNKLEQCTNICKWKNYLQSYEINN